MCRCMTALVFVLAAGLVPVGNAPAAAEALRIGFTGSYTTASGASGPLTGNFTLEGFTERDGNLLAFGTATYGFCVLPKMCFVGDPQRIEVPVASLSASCDRLHLVLGPVEFVGAPTFLGFTIHFNAASLTVSPESGPAANILCALAHRLDAASAGKLAPMLSQFIRLLADP